MKKIDFQEENNFSKNNNFNTGPRNGFITDYIIKMGLADDTKSARFVELVITIVIILLGIVYVLFRLDLFSEENVSQSIDTESAEFRSLPAEIQEQILGNIQ